MRRLPLVMAIVCLGAVALAAQDVDLTDPAVSSVAPREQEATLTYENRPIVVLRASIFNRRPADRVANATRLIKELVSQGVTGPVEARAAAGARVLSIAQRDVIAIVPADLDVLAGESIDATVGAATSRLQTALAEARELRSVRGLLRGGLVAASATVLLWFVLRVLRRTGRMLVAALVRSAQRRMTGTWRLLHVANLPRFAAVLVRIGEGIAACLLVYVWLSLVLRQFPYTRPWGESLRALLLGELTAGASAVSAALPGLITVAVILVMTRAVTKAIGLVFTAVEAERMSLPGVYPDTAMAARRLVTAGLWLLAVAMAYPHVPGSESSAFKGLSVFVGVVVSLGSSGVMQHLMSGLMLTFSRAVHVGDFARIGDVTGTIIQLGALATKVRTPYGEEITIPNAVVVSQNTTNFSNGTGADVPRLTASVTIGYDTPWRQVEALLLTAAEQTPGVREDPKPLVWREGLEDFYIKYTLLVAPDDPNQRYAILDRLHAQILDAFNQFGVQIMSPHYFQDPRERKLVPPSRWHDAPASAASGAGIGQVEMPRSL